MGRFGSTCRAMASGQNMLKTLLFGRSDCLVLGPLRSDGAPSSDGAPKDDSASSWRNLGVRGGDGGSDLKTGRSELVDQTAVSRSNSSGWRGT